MTEILEQFSRLMLDNAWFAPLLALLAGVITAFTPCCLSSVPLVIGYVGGTAQKTVKRSFQLSLTFSLGMVITSTVLGLAVAIAGTMLQQYIQGGWYYVILGILMFLMALQVWEVINVIPSTYLTSRSKKQGHIGAFIAGTLAGVFSSPCSTPVLVALLTIVAQQGEILRGTILLLLYSIGHSILFLLAGTFTGTMKKMMKNPNYGVWSNIIKYATGFVILLFALYLIYLGL